MNKVTEIMFSAIRTQVCGAQRIPYGDISDEDMKALYSLSKSQDMAHIVATELQAQGLLKDGHEISEKLRRHQMIALFRYERINYELTEICGVLEQSEIPHMPLKGSVMRKYYSEAWMRTSADIDILVKKEYQYYFQGSIYNPYPLKQLLLYLITLPNARFYNYEIGLTTFAPGLLELILFEILHLELKQYNNPKV